MSRPILPAMTVAEFLAWEERQDRRYEFDGLRPVPLAAPTPCHDRIQANLLAALRRRTRDLPCWIFGAPLRVEVGQAVRYPDAFVLGSRWPGTATLVQDPVIVFEVLSPETASLDRLTKNFEYASTPSVRRYVMLEQDRIAATVFARVDGEWRGGLLTEADMLWLPEIGTALPLAELYDDLELPNDPDTPGGET